MMDDKFEIFSKENLGSVRVCYDKVTSDAWFIAKDVCDCLELTNSRKTVADLDDDEKADVTISYTSSNGVTQRRKVTIISEPGLYRVIFVSRKEKAEIFKRWIAHEVLPSIRKNGSYVMGQEDLPKEKQEAMSMAIARLAKEVGAYKEDGNFWFEMYQKVLNDYADLTAALNGSTKKYTVVNAASSPDFTDIDGVWTDNQRFIIPNSVIAKGKYAINED